MRNLVLAWLTLVLAATTVAFGDEPSNTPKSVPANRPAMKEALEALKERTPRLPLPTVSDGEPSVNNGRMRMTYLPESWGSNPNRGNWGRNNSSRQQQRMGQDPNAKLDYMYTVPCFWVVSRGNNCHYCLGHQELKLRAGGMDDDTIASLDCDWSKFDPRQQAALEFARKLTLEPQLVGDGDIAKLKEHLSDPEIIELAFTVARFNATNRWTDGMGIPQDKHFNDERESTLTTPTSSTYQNRKSIVVPETRTPRPPVASLDQIGQAIAAGASRSPRVALPTNEEARKVLADAIGDRAPLAWEQALSALPVNGPAHVKIWNTITMDDNLTPRLKAEIAFITAANNGAWYAAAHAANRLKQLGASPEDLTSLLKVHEPGEGGAAAAYHLAATSTRDPHLITDADVAALRKGYSDQETAEIVQVICMANLFDRFTESLGLPVEAEIVDANRLSQR